MTVYTGLLDEDATTVDGVPFEREIGSVYARFIFELLEDEGDCQCDVLELACGWTCAGYASPMRWTPAQPALRFNLFNPPYVAAVRRG